MARSTNINTEKVQTHVFLRNSFAIFSIFITAFFIIQLVVSIFTSANLSSISSPKVLAQYAGSEPTITWDNSSGDGKWSTASNWSTDVLPTSADVVIFDSTSTTDLNIDTVVNVKGMYINSSYTGTIQPLSGASTSITIGSEGFTQNGGTVNLTSQGNSIPSSGLIANWQMDETSGTSLADSSSSNNTASSVSANIINGYTGKGRDIPANTGGYIGFNNNINMNGDWTISLYAYFPLQNTGSGWRTIAAQNGGNYHHILVRSDGELGSYNGGFYPASYNVNSLTGWHNITAAADNSGTSYYIDGGLVGTNANKTGANFSILGNYTIGGPQEAGKIDNVLVYNRKITASEVQSITGISNMTITGNFTKNAGSFSSPEYLYVSGNWSNAGTFNHSNGTVIFNGSNQSISGSTTFYNFTKSVTSAATLTFPGSNSQTQVIQGTLNLNGTSGNNLSLRSSFPGTQWRIDPQGPTNISYVDAQDSNNVNNAPIEYQVSQFTDSGNNTNWAIKYDCLTGGNHYGRDWVPFTACPGGIAGDHTNINTITIGSGDTVIVKPYDGSNYGTVSISAVSANINGTINANYAGYLRNLTATATNSGPGGSVCGGDSRAGASHGGQGGYSLYGIAPANAYGSLKNPVTMGSGGGIDGCAGASGSNGGGAIKLSTSGSLVLNGSLTANGQSVAIGRSGAGAGGSVWITAGTLSGNGSISTNGGDGNDYFSTAAGGGRISVLFGTNTFSGTLTSNGGTVGRGSYGNGSSGTVYIEDIVNHDLYVKNTQSWSADPALEGSSFTYRDVYIQNNSTLSLKGYYTNNTNGVGTTFNVQNLTIDSGSKIDGTGGGYAGNSTNKKGDGTGGGGTICPSGDSGGGGGHGGRGGVALYGDPGGLNYDSLTNPSDLGSAGGAGGCVTPGGSGGTAIKVIATGTITVNGSLWSNGGNSNGNRSGAGAGGTLNLTTNTLAGTGSIFAKGGSPLNVEGGNGAGGRIAVKFQTNNFSGSFSAIAGTGCIYGVAQDGTVYLLDTLNNDLYIKNSQNWFADPAKDGSSFTFRDVFVTDSSTLTLNGFYNTESDGIGFTFNARNLNIGSGSSFNANGTGYAGGSSGHASGYGSGGGKGTCSTGDTRGGGSYGGYGGGQYPGNLYGDAFAPVDLGSGGQMNYCDSYTGGAGGGAIKLNISNLLTLDGSITANGADGFRSSGGSGGSIWINTKDATGSGTITTNGGNNPGGCAVGGGGGRIAYYYTGSNGFSGTMTSNPGNSECFAGATSGTVIIQDATNNDLYIKNTQTWNANPSLEGSAHTYHNIYVQNSSTWSFVGYYTDDSDGIGFNFSAANIQIDTGSKMYADGGGYSGGNSNSHPAGYGPGGGYGPCGDYRGGGSYGGSGSGQFPGAIYGSMYSPDKLGSGGMLQNCGGYAGSNGGGAIKITTTGTLIVNGSLTANGADAFRASAGSGGSIWIVTNNLTGGGAITTNGGNGGGGYCNVGGGGGRTAIYFAGSNSFSGTYGSNGGTGECGTGTTGSYYIKDSTNNDLYILTSQTWRANPGLEGSIFNYRNVYIQNNSTLKLYGFYTNESNGVGFTFNVSNITLDSGSTIDTNGGGYLGASSNTDVLGHGPGGGGTNSSGITTCGQYRGSGAYGGAAAGNYPGLVYGNAFTPDKLGSGGLAEGCNSYIGGAGGGAVKLNATNSVTINGTIGASGPDVYRSNAGSGGSIWIVTVNMAGSGPMSTNGGNDVGGACGTGGGGGRIAIAYSGTNNYSGTLSSTGGASDCYAGAENGTVVIQDTTNNDLYISNTQTWKADPANEGSSFNFRNVTVTNNATLNLTGYYTTESNGVGFNFNTTNFSIASGSKLSADGRGYSGGTSNTDFNGHGPGGAGKNSGLTSCGGYRGSGSYGGIGSGNYFLQPYGSLFSPTDLGSGGMIENCGSSAGGNGGGAIKITASNSLSLAGDITANGPDTYRTNAGSGGSIWLITKDFSGAGNISTNGGSTFGGYCVPGGSGGRISINYSGANSYSGVVLSNGGTSDCYVSGENGTVVLRDTTNNDLYIKNSQPWRSNPSLEGTSFTFRDINFSNNATLTIYGYYTNDSDGVGMTLNATRNFTLSTGSAINANGRGYLPSTSGSHPGGYGPGGALGDCADSRGGGSYGGRGGGRYAGNIYGNAFAPDKLGSSGRMNGCTYGIAGAGGGAFKINVSNQLTLDGTLTANGQDVYQSSAGSGGSIWVVSKNISGAGSVTASGGSGGGGGCNIAGGGGRISFNYSGTNTYSGTLSSPGGTSSDNCETGADNGTVVIKDTTNNDLYIKNSQTWSADPTREGAQQTFRNVYIQNNAKLNLQGYYTSNVNGFGFTINAQNLTVDTGSYLSADSSGYAGAKNSNGYVSNTLADGAGPGGGQGNNCSGNFTAGAASYGGTGGNSSVQTYGSLTAPLDLGSGGGAGAQGGGCLAGGFGGGAIRLIVTDTLLVNGGITANGQNAGPGGGAGSGGSIYVTAGILNSSDTAVMYARGGNSNCGTCAGNGGGGRIAIYFSGANNWQGDPITPTNASRAGQGGIAGADGTVFIGQAAIPGITSLRQYRSNCTSIINVGGATSQSSVCLGGTINSESNPDNLTAQIELQPIGTAFTDSPNYQTNPIPFTGSPVSFTIPVSGITIGTSYHWQVRVLNEIGAYSEWISFGNNFESETDFSGQYPNISFMEASTSQGEGLANPSIYVVLNDSISSSVTVDYSVTGGTAVLGEDYNLSSGTLTFPADTTVQSIPLTIINDQIQKSNRTIQITLSNPANGTIGSIGTYTYTIINDDFAGFNVFQGTGGSNQVVEGGVSDSFYLSLRTKPTDDVVVTIQSNSQFTYSTSTLTFTPSNWSNTQEVIVTAVNDDVSQGNRFVNINFNVSSTDPFYNNYSFGSVTFEIIDNDIVGVTLIGGTDRTIGENSGSSAIGFVLTSKPSADVVIHLTPSNGGITASLPTLTFTPTNWFTPQYSYAVAVNDFVTQGTHYSTMVMDVSSSDLQYDGYSGIQDVNVTILDDDTPGVSISNNVNLVEGGNSQNYGIKLNTQPTSDVTIDISPNAAVQLSSESLIFTSSNWNTYQIISVTAVHDFVATGNRTIPLSHTATSSDNYYQGISIQNVNINISDIDIPNISIAETAGGTTISESGTTDTYSVVLTTSPTSPVDIHMTPDNAEIHVSTPTLTFDDSNWNVPQFVEVSIDHDSVAGGNRTRHISHSATSVDSVYDNISVATINVNVQDSDAAGYNITETLGGTYVTEGGATDTFSIVLTSKPLFNVVINLVPNDQLTYNPNALVFTDTNWNVPQSSTVAAVNDLIAQGNRTTNLELSPTSSDNSYGGLAHKYVNVSITDNDVAGLFFQQSGGNTSVVKGAATDSYTVVLTAQPQANVTINLTPESPLQTSPTSLSFNAGNWSIPQTVTVSATNDGVSEAPFSKHIQHTLSSTDLNYNSLPPYTLSATITSNVPPQVLVSKTSITKELNGATGSDSYQIVLQAIPTSNVVININNTSDAIQIVPSTLNFTTSNWNVPQTISLTFDPAKVSVSGVTTDLQHSIVTSDPGYSALSVQNVTIHLTNSAASITPTPTPSVSTTPTSTGTATNTGTSTPTQTPTNGGTTTPTNTATSTPTASSTATTSPTASSSETPAPTSSENPSPSSTSGNQGGPTSTTGTQPSDTATATGKTTDTTSLTPSVEPTNEQNNQNSVATFVDNVQAQLDKLLNVENQSPAVRQILESIQQTFNSLTDGIAGGYDAIATEAGPLSPVVLVVFIPYLVILIIYAAILVTSIVNLYLFAKQKKVKIIDSLTKDGLNFVTVKLVDQETGRITTRITLLGGNFAARLNEGTYKILINKNDYNPVTSSVEIASNNQFIEGEFQMDKKEESDVFYNLQFNVKQVNLWLIVGIFSFILSIINVIALQNIWSYGLIAISVGLLGWGVYKARTGISKGVEI